MAASREVDAGKSADRGSGAPPCSFVAFDWLRPQFRRRLILILALMMVASCDRHPMAPAVPTRPTDAQLETARSLSPGEQSIGRQPSVDDLAAVPPSEQSVPLRAVVDDYPAWSPDGRWIAFHRRYLSSYGPPGLYLVPRHGGAPRLLLTGGFFFPTEASFSPDGERLVCNSGNQLVFVDLGSGAISRPLYTDNGATHPDWSPDGRRVVYFRVFLRGFPPEPPDSAGLHVFDVDTGLDRALWSGAEPAGPSKWIRDGMALAVLHGDHAGWHFSIVALDGSQIASRVISVPFPKTLWNLQHLEPARPRAGPRATESVVMLVLGRTIERTLEVTINPVAISDRRRLLGLWDALSPDGKEVAAIRPDPADSLGVLYVGHADAPPQARMFQLTRYEPP